LEEDITVRSSPFGNNSEELVMIRNQGGDRFSQRDPRERPPPPPSLGGMRKIRGMGPFRPVSLREDGLRPRNGEGKGKRMQLKVAPTRGNMVRIARSLVQARSGHDLLEQKRQVLMMELVRHIEAAKTVQADVERLFSRAYGALQRANISLGIDSVEEIAEAVPLEEGVTIRLRSVMGVEIPEVDPLPDKAPPATSFHDTNAALDEAFLAFREVLALITRLAQTETSVLRLAVQIRKTHRRVNALEKIIIPDQKASVAFIADVLEEQDREDFVRMKIAKDGRGA
jgi:V/A-type H+-transporting ATPase subunit D